MESIIFIRITFNDYITCNSKKREKKSNVLNCGQSENVTTNAGVKPTLILALQKG